MDVVVVARVLSYAAIVLSLVAIVIWIRYLCGR